ncbi:MAG: Rho termination factor N-terminal domain-containing protein, partial [Anaerolineaceae bacterium]
MDILELEKMTLTELRNIAKDLNIPRSNLLKKENLMIRIRQAEAEKEGQEIRGG